MKKQTRIALISIGVILLILLIWGLIGSSQSTSMGITCDIGIGEDGSVFCWKWHRNIVGDVADAFNDFFKK